MASYLKLAIFVSLLVITHQEMVDYCKLLHNSLLFYEAQRSGRLPPTNRVPWRGDSALNDCKSPCVKDENGDGDLAGGYYDAGDHVKFGLPGAWSLTTLSWGLLEFRSAVEACGEVAHYEDALRWGLDWWIKAHPEPNVLYGQVGDGDVDHAFWGPPEDMTMERPSYKIDPGHPGTEVALEAAAMFAAASLVFNHTDREYAGMLLAHARELWTFGTEYQGSYVDSIEEAKSFYNSYSGFNDEIVWGTLWLYRATGEESYLARAKSDYAAKGIAGAAGGNALDWDSKAAGAVVLIAKITGETSYKNDANKWLASWRPGGSAVTYTPGGLAWLRQWGPCRYAATTAFLALVNDATGDNDWAASQINYMAGVNQNQQSFIVGYGPNSPINPHHRAAHHSTTHKIDSPVNNVYLLVGALLGGPTETDGFTDDRTNYISNEVALDYNAGFTGALAGLLKLYPDGNNATIPVNPTTGGGGSTTAAATTGAGVCGAGVPERAGCAGVSLKVNENINKYWYAVMSPVEGISAAVQTIDIKDQGSFTSWNKMKWESWEAWSWGTTGGFEFTPPISLRITLCNGHVLTLNDIIANLTTGGAQYCGVPEITYITTSSSVATTGSDTNTPGTTGSGSTGGNTLAPTTTTNSTTSPDNQISAGTARSVNFIYLLFAVVVAMVVGVL